MKQDRFLLVILGVIGLLIVLAVGLFFARQGPQEYGPEDNPEGVLRNYVLALQNEDYARAYKYLQDAKGKPDFTQFRQRFLTIDMSRERTSVQIGEVDQTDEDAVVGLIITYGGNQPFTSNWSEKDAALLMQQEGEWKLTYMPYPYWDWDWYSE